jgi:hypothetical protein
MKPTTALAFSVAAEEVLKSAEDTVYIETFKRQMIQTGKYRTKEIYQRLSPELDKLFEGVEERPPRGSEAWTAAARVGRPNRLRQLRQPAS